jgi:hypothetical protein
MRTIKTASSHRVRAPTSATASPSFDLGWVVGLGLGVGHGQFDLRYSGGLTDISDSPILGGAIPAADGTGVKLRNRGFVLMATIRL